MEHRQKPHASSDQVHISVATGGYGDEKSPEDFLTVREAAKLMRIGRDMAYTLVAEGRSPAIRLGRHIRIPRASLITRLHEEAERLTGEAS